jgi:pimeloyl-ACP methyl ester carboxylesterase
VSVPGVREVTARVLPLALSSGLALNVAYAAVITHGRRIDAKTLARTKKRALASLPGAREGTRAVVAAGASRRAFHKRRVAFPGPVWALWGEHDHLVPREHADGVRRAFPQAQVEEWPGMGHHPQHERPSELLELIERACASADDQRRSLARAG